jgi:hypothetical protein
MRESLSEFQAVTVCQISPKTCTVMLRGNASPRTTAEGEVCHDCDTYIVEDVPGVADEVRRIYEDSYQVEFDRLHAESVRRETFIKAMLASQNAREYLAGTDYRVIKAVECGKALDELYPGETERRDAARNAIREFEALRDA